jgi:hypothetical protein
MAQLTPDQIDDLVTNTTKAFKRSKWEDISLEYQTYVSGEFINDHRIVEQGGTEIQWQLQVANTGTSVNSGLWAQDVTAVDDITISASVPWSKQTASWSYDVDEPLFQSDKETIVEMLLIREHSCMNKLHELNEVNLWSEPSSSSDKRPMGIPFWIRKSSTTADGGFTGGNPTATGLTGGCAGVDSTTYPKWRNWSFNYTAVTPDDLVRKIKKALRYTRFVAPHPHPELGFGGVDYVIYTTYAVVEPLERLAESRNDNLGADVARYLNRVTVAGVPFRDVPYLTETDTSNPLYGVNFRSMRPFVKKGCNMRRSGPLTAPAQHTVRNNFIDTWMGYMCINRRDQWIGYVA